MFRACGSTVLAAAFPGLGIGFAGVALAFGIIASGKAGFDVSGGFASNGYGAHSPGGYSLSACLTAEVVLTFMFLAISPAPSASHCSTSPEFP
jgi:hypothetical protein